MARSAAKSGVEAYQAGNYEEAVELLGRAESVVHAPTHLLFIARAQAKLGNLVEAKEAYLKLINERLGDDPPPAFEKAQTDAKSELAEVQARLSSLKIIVKGAERSDVQVTIDEKPLPNIAIGVFTDASPGERRLVISAAGKEAQELSVTLEEGKKETVEVKLADAAETPAGEESETGVVLDAENSPTASSQKTWGYVLAGTGVAGLGVGAAFGFMTLSAAKKARNDDALCPDEQCTSEGRDHIQSAQTKGMVANIALGVGAGLVAVGAYFVITAPKSGDEVVRVVPEVGPGVAGLSLGGQF